MPTFPPISLWMDQLSGQLDPRPALRGTHQVDVAIIGAGYTGLWTAYYLKQLDPDLRIAVLEAQIAGHGASGRNGGWLIGELAGEDRLLAKLDPQARQDSLDLLRDIPDEVARVTARAGIDCDLRKGGGLYCAARYPEQETRLRLQLAAWHAHGHSEADYRWLTPAELDRQLHMASCYGAVQFSHLATIHPARLVRGLAACVESQGVELFEHSPVQHWRPSEVCTPQGRVQARWVVPAVEGYGVTLPPLGRHQLAAQSLMIATEPLPDASWAQIGLDQGQAFCENSRQVSYGQRTRDNRMVFGARGGYRFGGKLRREFMLTPAEVELRRRLLVELFPSLADVRISHAWGGNLGVSRRFRPHMVCDREHRVAWAGGYGGEGVGASNLAGRTLAALILDRPGRLTRQPWVMTPAGLSRWEPEPLRWIGYNGIVQSFVLEDSLLGRAATPRWLRRGIQGWADVMESLMR